MKQGLRWVLWSVAGVLLLAVALWGASRLWGVRASERAALAQMRTEWTPQGRNGFDALWTYRHDVPTARQAEVVDADIRTIRSWSASSPKQMPFRSAAAAYTDLAPVDADAGMLCQVAKPGCLEKVSADIESYVALVTRNARLIERADALGGYDHIKSRVPWRVDTPMPQLVFAYAPATRDALLFAQGERQQALRNVCRGIASWRRYASNSDTLLTAMVATSNASDGYGRLFADMLAALPAGEPVPAECGDALADVTPAELSLCQAMKGEFAYGDTAMRGYAEMAGEGPMGGSAFAQRFLFDVEGTSALNAANLAPACGSRIADMVTQDVPVPSLQGERRWGRRFACVGNPVGCILSDIAAPAYVDYVLRRQDFGMKLKVLGTLLWLREHPQPGVPLAERLSQRPAGLKSAARDIEIDQAGRQLHIRLYRTDKGATWTAPLGG